MYQKKCKQNQDSKSTQTNIKETRRSSLQVNLSYTFDLSDSENTDNTENTNNKYNDNKNTSTSSITNDISRVLANISDKDKVLSENCSRLRDQIMNKTRQLFDKQNEFHQMTTKVLEQQTHSSNKPCKSNYDSPILRSSRNVKVINLSPRKTRAKTMRERLNSYITSNSQTNIDESLNEITSIGSPIISSTFTENHCKIHESCNVKKIIHNSVKNVSITTAPQINKKKLSIRTIKTCNVQLDKIDGYQHANRSKTLREVPMELTTVQGNCILNKTSLQNEEKINKINPVVDCATVSKCDSSKENLSNVIENITSSDGKKSNYSMNVNTSLDRQSNYINKMNSTIVNVPHQNDEIKKDDKITNAIVHATIDSAIDCDNYEDEVSLMERLRNISQKENQKQNLTPKHNKNNDSPGIIDGTPVRMTRSMMLRSQLKFNSLDEKTKSQCINKTKLKNHPYQVNPVNNTVELEKTIVLDSTQFRINNNGTQGPIIIEESSNDESQQTIQLNNNMETSTKPIITKKKLFTQHDSSSVASFSPLSHDIFSPQVKKLKQLRRRRIKRNMAGRIINPRSIIGKSQGHQLTQIVLTSSSASSQDLDKNRDFEKCRKKKRIIKSKKFVAKKQLRTNLLNTIDEIQEKSFNEDPQTSRNSNVFMAKKQFATKRNYRNRKIIIVPTGLCNGDKNIIKNAVKNLSGAIMESLVTRKTTHVVTTGVRTINLLRGIIRGCWLVKFDWIKKSVEAGKWLSAEGYEIQHFSKAVEENRRDREMFGRSYVPDLFTACGLIHIQRNTTPPCEVLKELIKTAGGLITEEMKKSKIIIGRDGIKENWVLDSITTGELQPIKSYER